MKIALWKKSDYQIATTVHGQMCCCYQNNISKISSFSWRERKQIPPPIYLFVACLEVLTTRLNKSKDNKVWMWMRVSQEGSSSDKIKRMNRFKKKKLISKKKLKKKKKKKSLFLNFNIPPLHKPILSQVLYYVVICMMHICVFLFYFSFLLFSCVCVCVCVCMLCIYSQLTFKPNPWFHPWICDINELRLPKHIVSLLLLLLITVIKYRIYFEFFYDLGYVFIFLDNFIFLGILKNIQFIYKFYIPPRSVSFQFFFYPPD